MGPEATSREDARPWTVPTWATFAAVQLMGFLVAFSLVWPLLRTEIATIGFVLAWVLASLYLLRKRYPADVVGSGLYAAAVGVSLTPIEVYLPSVAAGTDIGGFSGATMVATGARDLIVWGVACGVVAVAMLALGRYFKGVAKRRREREHKVRRWAHQR